MCVDSLSKELRGASPTSVALYEELRREDVAVAVDKAYRQWVVVLRVSETAVDMSAYTVNTTLLLALQRQMVGAYLECADTPFEFCGFSAQCRLFLFRGPVGNLPDL